MSGSLMALTRMANPMVRAVLRSPLHRLLSGSVLELSYMGRRSGRRHVLPVMYAALGNQLIVVAARSDTKTWWRNFDGDESRGEVRLRGREQKVGIGQLPAGTPAHSSALAAYRTRFPRAPIEPDDPVFALTIRA